MESGEIALLHVLDTTKPAKITAHLVSLEGWKRFINMGHTVVRLELSFIR